MCKLAYSKPLSRTGDGDSSERHCGEAERNEDRKGRNADGRAQYRIIYILLLGVMEVSFFFS